jgi:hypothetical protein
MGENATSAEIMRRFQTLEADAVYLLKLLRTEPECAFARGRARSIAEDAGWALQHLRQRERNASCHGPAPSS